MICFDHDIYKLYYILHLTKQFFCLNLTNLRLSLLTFVELQVKKLISGANILNHTSAMCHVLYYSLKPIKLLLEHGRSNCEVV